jgi:predicted dehydrogenase
MSKRIGVGIIGTGFARRVQIPAFLACDGAFIASVASGRLENARTTAEDCGAGHFTDDWRQTVARDDVDLVVITTPPNLHKEMVLASVEAGKHILCEKPMAMNVAEAVQMAEAVKGKNLLAVLDHELRFLPGRQLAFEMLRQGRIGKIRHARCIFQAPHRGDPTAEWNWWSDIEQGGGALGAIGSHLIDSFNWYLGVLPATVFCQLQTHIKQRSDSAGNPRGVTTDDELHLIFKYEESQFTTDATGMISISMTDGPAYQNVLELYGPLGAIKLNHRGELYTAGTDGTDWTPVPVGLGREIPGLHDTGFARGFMEFAPKIITAIEGANTGTDGSAIEIEHAATFTDGVNIQKILDAARISDNQKQAVTI